MAEDTCVDKQCSTGNAEADSIDRPDNVLLQDSLILRGSGKAVVLVVGSRTRKE